MTDSNTQPIDTPVVQALVAKYVAIRDLKKRINEEAELKLQKCAERLEEIEAQLNAEMTKQGADSIKTPHGTCYFSKRYRASAEDWPAIEAYVLQTGRLDIFERRIASSVVKDIVDTTGELPPGVKAEITRTVNVRKS